MRDSSVRIFLSRLACLHLTMLLGLSMWVSYWLVKSLHLAACASGWASHACRAEASTLLGHHTLHLTIRPFLWQVRAAQALGNYSAFFRLYMRAPGHSQVSADLISESRPSPLLSPFQALSHLLAWQYVMDTYADQERLNAVRKMLKVYQPSLPLAFIAVELGFEDHSDAAFFLTDHGVVLEGTGESASVDCKSSRPRFVEHSISQKLEEEMKQLQRKAEIVPISFS